MMSEANHPIEGLRRICLEQREAIEKPFGGHTTPTFRMRDKIFAMCDDGYDGGGPFEVWCKAPPGAQEVLVGADPERFFVPPYVGHNGWIGVRLHDPVDWDVIAELIKDSYRMTAPKRLAALLGPTVGKEQQ